MTLARRAPGGRAAAAARPPRGAAGAGRVAASPLPRARRASPPAARRGTRKIPENEKGVGQRCRRFFFFFRPGPRSGDLRPAGREIASGRPAPSARARVSARPAGARAALQPQPRGCRMWRKCGRWGRRRASGAAGACGAPRGGGLAARRPPPGAEARAGQQGDSRRLNLAPAGGGSPYLGHERRGHPAWSGHRWGRAAPFGGAERGVLGLAFAGLCPLRRHYGSVRVASPGGRWAVESPSLDSSAGDSG